VRGDRINYITSEAVRRREAGGFFLLLWLMQLASSLARFAHDARADIP
jgi:hypothetical protein